VPQALPPDVAAACAGVASAVPLRSLTRAASELSERYRAASARPGSVDPRIRSHEEAVASLVTRFPATFAACERAARLMGEEMPGFRPRGLVDVGAGSGASALAVRAVWPELGSVRLVERSRFMAEVGQDLLSRIGLGRERGWIWTEPDETADLVVLSYVVGEQPPEAVSDFVDRWWARCSGVLLVVEPGTPSGFRRVARAREELIVAGGHVVAPCPHDGGCPLSPAGRPGAADGDWCHFAVRLPRSSLHRRLKGGELSYEDEKFSFVAVSRDGAATAGAHARILRRPVHARHRIDGSSRSGVGRC
jgi:ribosomal protein RSM22 (predicted rRNA methylase)